MQGLAKGRAAGPGAGLGGAFHSGRPPACRVACTRRVVGNPCRQTGWRVRGHGGTGPRGVRAAVTNGANSGSEPLATSQGVENLVIIGSGPAGYTAAIYAARANLRPLVYEGYQVGGSPGGQLMTTGEVENFPGFPEGVSGPDLMDLMRRQAERWGARLVTEDVVSLDLHARPFVVTGTDTSAVARSVIVATGATAKRLGLPGEAAYWGAGVSACAICDGASPLFRGRDLVVVGGGDTAAEEALYLTKFGAQVHLLVRGPRMRASAAMQQRVRRAPRVHLHLHTAPVEVLGDGGVMTGVRVRDARDGADRIIPAAGLFYGIGHAPNSSLLAGTVELDGAGYVVPAGSGGATSVPGVFAAGDLQDREWRQAVTAAGSGCAAALAAERWLAAEGWLDDEAQQGSAVVESNGAAAVTTPSSAAATTPTPGPYRGAAPGADAFDPEAIRHRGQYALRRLYHEWDGLMAVLYTAPSCAPCRTVKPILRSVVDEAGGAVKLVEIDIEDDPEIAQAAGVNSTPTLQLFRAKERLLHQPGVKMKREYRALLDKYLAGAGVA